MPPREVPPELVEWIETRVELLVKTSRKAERKADPREGQPVHDWVIPLLEDLASAERISQRAVHLLSAYAIRTGAATQSEVARATDVAVTTAATRPSSKAAREAWAEVWPGSPPMP